MKNYYHSILVFFLLSFLYSDNICAQNFGHEWIVPSQKYYKVKVASEGIYKISYEKLANTIDESFLHSNSRLQLWHRGRQQSLGIKAAGDSLKSGDYLYFYGIKNDGEQDAELYYPKTNLYNQYNNLFSDSTSYFLTISESSPYKRIDTLAGNKMNNNSSYFMTQNIKNYIETYWNVGNIGNDPTETFFTPGEGWSSNGRSNQIEKIAVPNFQNSDSIEIEVYVSGLEQVEKFSPKIFLLSANNSDTILFPFIEDRSSLYGAVKATLKILRSDLSSFIENNSLKISAKSEKAYSYNYIKISFPQKADLKSIDKLHFNCSKQFEQSLKIVNVPSESIFMLVDDRNSAKLIRTNFTNDTTFLPNLDKGSSIFYSKSMEEISTIFPVEFKEYQVTNNTFLILSHNNLMASATKYAEYRQSTSGGNYNVLLTEINQITDQFSYGERSPLAIRRFLNFLKSKNISSPEYFFIIGMGLQLDYNLSERQNESTPNYEGDLILPAGCPAGDMVYSIGLDGKPNTNLYANIKNRLATIATGRISARNNTEVLNYLDKVKEHDALDETATWRRNVLHLSGGYNWRHSFEYNQQQSALFRDYMDASGSIIKQPFFGANVKLFGRYMSGNSELIDVSTEVNKGVSIITFLGHSSQSTTDVTIGYVSNNTLNYNNKGKYPMLFLNGCEVGNTFYNLNYMSSFLLDWIFTKNRGAIIGLSNTGTGFANKLRQGIDNMYISSFLDSLNFAKSIGEQVKLAQKRYYTIYSDTVNPDIYTSSMIQNMTIQGDPAIRIFNTPKPDFETICERIALKSSSNLKITSQSDSFEILIPIKNYGMYIRGTLGISVKRYYSNNTKSVQYPVVYFLPTREVDTLRYKIKGKISDAFGANVFEIILDPENKVGELNKANNSCVYTAYIPGNSLACLYPKKFSIVNKQPVTFIAESYTVTTKEREYYFELDTNYRFNSGFKRSFTAKSYNTPRWPDQMLLDNVNSNDSIVYYWRVRYVQAQASEDTAYSYSSFIYIKSSPEGWSQSEYPQFFEDEARAVKVDSNSGKWNFQKLSANLLMTTIGADTNVSQTFPYMSYKGVPLIYNNLCGFDGLYLLTINAQDLGVRLANPEFVGADNPVIYMCNRYSSIYVGRFLNHPAFPEVKRKFHEVLKDKINKGEIIALIGIGKGHFPLPDSTSKLLQEVYGASDQLDTMKNGYPYLLIARKGFGKIVEKRPTTHSPFKEIISIDTSIYSQGYGGYISSPLIGPAIEWGNFFRGYQKEKTDSIRFDIMGIDSAGHETLVVPNVKEDNVSLLNLVNAEKYPFLRLNAYKETITSNTPQLTRWQVIYRPAPEGAIIVNEKSEAEYAAFSKQEGDSSKSLKFTFKNISNESFKPNLLVRYRITNATKIVDRYDTLKSALLPDSSWISTFKISTLGFVGDNTVEVFFNPIPNAQKEELLENNRYTFQFNVLEDKIHPILEVAFDGQRIMNGDIVSPNPTISIAINDENKYLIQKDTTGLTLELQKPCGHANCPFEKVYLGGNDITIYPAGSTNKFEIRYKPEKLPDGVYTLRVQAKDVSGNLSGVKPYTIQFEVINEVAITNFLPYPNPFSTRMWFVYTLTGDMPDQLRIQIMTVTGKVVRQIFMDELGPLRIGTHKTDFVWDGTDDFGDQLANGLYIYKVSARKGGEELKHRNTTADNLFKNGYGKLYILR